MPYTDWSVINTSLQRSPAPPPDTARVFAAVAPVSPAGQPKAKRYSSTTELEDDGWGPGFALYNALATMFAQTPVDTAVSGVVVIARETALPEVWTVDIVDTTDATISLLVNGVVVTSVIASGNTDIEIRDGLILGLIGSGYTGAIVDDDTLTVTSDTPGVPFVLTSTATAGTPPDVGAGPTTPAIGIYDDLEAAHKLINFWGVLAPAATDADLDEARRWCGADSVGRRCHLFGENSDPGVFDVLDTDNLAVQWVTGAYPRASLFSHPLATEYFAAGMIGRVGGGFPGQRAWHKLTVSGLLENVVTPDRSSDGTATARARRVMYSERFFGPESSLQGVSSENIAGGNFIYQRWAVDWWWFTIRAAVEEILTSNEGVDLTDEGLQKVATLVTERSLPLINAGVLAPGPTVTFVPVADIPPGEAAIGDYKTTGLITYTGVITPKLRALRVEGVFQVVA